MPEDITVRPDDSNNNGQKKVPRDTDRQQDSPPDNHYGGDYDIYGWREPEAPVDNTPYGC